MSETKEFYWRCSSCGHECNEGDEIGIWRCPHCGHELDDDEDRWKPVEPAKEKA